MVPPVIWAAVGAITVVVDLVGSWWYSKSVDESVQQGAEQIENALSTLDPGMSLTEFIANNSLIIGALGLFFLAMFFYAHPRHKRRY